MFNSFTRAFSVFRSRFVPLALTVISFSVLAGTARANVIFDFSGTCSVQCSGTATGVLTLTDAYIIGTDIPQADFISFTYSSSDANFTITSATLGNIAGGLKANGSFDSAGQLNF